MESNNNELVNANVVFNMVNALNELNPKEAGKYLYQAYRSGYRDIADSILTLLDLEGNGSIEQKLDKALTYYWAEQFAKDEGVNTEINSVEDLDLLADDGSMEEFKELMELCKRHPYCTECVIEYLCYFRGIIEFEEFDFCMDTQEFCYDFDIKELCWVDEEGDHMTYNDILENIEEGYFE